MHNKSDSAAPQVSACASSDSKLVREAFEEADEDGSGTLDADELQLVVEKLHMSITVEEVESEMGAGAYRDDDGNVSIDLETFAAWWKAHESDPMGRTTWNKSQTVVHVQDHGAWVTSVRFKTES